MSVKRATKREPSPATSSETFQVFVEMEAKRLVFAFEVEPAAELGWLKGPALVVGERLDELAVVMGDQKLGAVPERGVVGVGQGIVAEQIAEPRDHRVDVGVSAAVPEEENVTVADLEQFAPEFPDEAVELARRYAQLVVAPVTRLQAGQMEMDDPPVVVVALQLAHQGEQLGLYLVVLGCLHDRLRKVVAYEERGGAHVGQATGL